jgi:hypothetical protein
MGEQANPNWERLREIEALTARLLPGRPDRTEGALQQLADHALKHAAQIAKIDQILIRLDEKIAHLAASRKHSDARLDALIAAVDDLVRKNGGRGNAPLQ